MTLKAPTPWFGGKAPVAAQVWRRFGNTPNFIDPFMGSAALLLGRPSKHLNSNPTETINDLNGFIVNAYRAIRDNPELVAYYANRPVFESDMHAIHAMLINQRSDLTIRLEGDPEYYDPKVAGWWIWGQCVWLGHGWCSADGPWISVEGRLVNRRELAGLPEPTGENGAKGVSRKRPQLMNNGRGVARAIPFLGNDGKGVQRNIPSISNQGQGVRRKLPNVSKGGHGITKASIQFHQDALIEWFSDLADRLSRVRICCGDWRRVLKPAITVSHGLTAVFLDPPYPHAERDAHVYAEDDDPNVAYEVRAWAVKHGSDPRFRIAYCGYDDGFKFPDGWTVYRWTANGGYGNLKNGRGRANKFRETIWFSPYCLDPNAGYKQLSFLNDESED